jgi:hypothetical protein
MRAVGNHVGAYMIQGGGKSQEHSGTHTLMHKHVVEICSQVCHAPGGDEEWLGQTPQATPKLVEYVPLEAIFFSQNSNVAEFKFLNSL